MSGYKIGGSGAGSLSQLAEALADNDRFLLLNVSDTATAPADPDGSDQWIASLDLAQYAAQKTLGKALVHANTYCAGDGGEGGAGTDDTAGMRAAINAALAGAGLGFGGVYCPDQYRITSSLTCTNAAGSGGAGVRFVGAARGDSIGGAGIAGSAIIKDFNGALLTYNGSDGPNANPVIWGGTSDIMLDGDGHTGPLLQSVTGQRMFFVNTSFDNNPDTALDLQSLEDTYFVGCVSNNCGSATAPAWHVYGSAANGTSNMLWFIQCRIEAFRNGALKIDTGPNNGIFFSQCKFETTTVHGDVIQCDGTVQQLVIDQCFFALDSFDTGYSTPANCVKFGDGASGSGNNQFTLSNTWVHAGTGVMDSVVNVNGGSGGTAMTGPLELRNVTWDNTPVTSAMILNGVGSMQVSWQQMWGPGALFSGDGSFVNLDGGITLIGGLAVVNGYVGQAFPTTMPYAFIWDKGIGFSGITTGTGAPVFSVGTGDDDFTTVGSAGFQVDDNDNSFFKGVAAHNGGTSTSGTAAASTPAFTQGTAKQLSTTQDVMLYVNVTVATNLTLAIGPASTTTTTVFASATAAIGVITVRVPKGWWVKASSSGTFSNFKFTQVTC